MNRFFIIATAALAGILASCGSSVTSSTKTPTNVTYSVDVSPIRLALNEGDHSSVTATVDQSYLNGAPTAVSPQPTIKFYSSDTRVSISPAGKVCAGQWDSRYMNCVATPSATYQCVPATKTTPASYCQGLPANPITVTAFDAAHNVSGTVQVWIHERASHITLCAPTQAQDGTTTPCYGTTTSFDPLSGASATTTVTRTPSGYYPANTNCVSQGKQVKYFAQATEQITETTSVPLDSCSVSDTPGCVSDQDYTWSSDNTSVATVGQYGGVVAVNPGVTNIHATLNGTVSSPLAFATCPPAGIQLDSSGYTKNVPVPPYSTADLTPANNTYLYKGSLQYFTALNALDTNGNPLLVDSNSSTINSLSLSFLSSNRLIGAFSTVTPMTDLFTATTSGRTIFSVSCTPTTCNPGVSDFVSPTGTKVTGESAGYGYPIYSNVIGGVVTGTTSSVVLVTGTEYPNTSCTSSTTTTCPQPHELLVYDSESLQQTQNPISLANLPNSLVVAPNGTTAYVGSSDGLVVINLTTYQPLPVPPYTIAGGLSTDVITGKVLGVSPDSRYVVTSDIANGLVFLIDTTKTTQQATRYEIPGIRAVTFASDMSEFWIAGDSGVYTYQADSFIQTASSANASNGAGTAVTALAWTADGQSYFAAGNQLVNYSTCNDTKPQLQTAGPYPVSLSASAINGTPRVVGFSTSSTPGTWLDYSVASSSAASVAAPVGNVCLSTVTVNNPPASAPLTIGTPVSAASTIACTPQQFTFSDRLEQEFITGVNPKCATAEAIIHYYDLTSQKELTLSLNTALDTVVSAIVPLSGGVLTDGRELYIGEGSTSSAAYLHRFMLLTTSGAQGTLQEDIAPISVPVVPSFVAVVPK
jgi:hypothetical protein